MSLKGFEETSLLLATSRTARQVTDIRFNDQVAVESLAAFFVLQQSPANVSAVGLHGFVQSGTFALVAPADRTAELQTFLNNAGTFTRSVLRSLSAQRGVSGNFLPYSVRAVYPGDVVRFGAPLPQGAVIVVVNMNQAVPNSFPNVGNSNADAKFGGSPLIRWYSDEALASNPRLGFIPTPYRTPTLDPETSFTGFGAQPGIKNSAQYLSPTARTLMLRFLTTGSTRLTAEVCDFKVWFRDMVDGYWCHHPQDDLIDGYRGAINAQHDVETYKLNGCVDMVQVVYNSGSTVKVTYTIAD